MNAQAWLHFEPSMSTGEKAGLKSEGQGRIVKGNGAEQFGEAEFDGSIGYRRSLRSRRVGEKIPSADVLG